MPRDPVSEWESWGRESLEFHREKERQQNEDSRLPDGETVHLPAIWIAEVYFASHLPGLLAGIEALGWVTDRDLGAQQDLARWIRGVRLRGWGAGHHMGIQVAANGEGLGLMHGYEFSTDLPAGVRALRLDVFQPSPTYIVITIQFDLKETVADELNSALRAYYPVEVEAVGRGLTVVEPWERRTIESTRVRSRVYRDCCEFVAEHLPGYFSARSNESDPFPSAELLLLTSTPLVIPPQPRRHSFIDCLGLYERLYDFVGVDHKGLVLGLPRDREKHRGATFAANLAELLPDEDLGPYGGRSPRGFANRLRDLSSTVALWAVAVLMSDLHAEIAEARDAVGAESRRTDDERGRRLDFLHSTVAVLVSDFLATLTDWQSGDGLTYLEGDDLPDFEPREPRGWGTRTVGEVLAGGIKADAERMLGSIAILRESVQIQSTLAAARASVQVARTNISLQKVALYIAGLALLVAIAGIWLDVWERFAGPPPPPVTAPIGRDSDTSGQ